MQKESTLLAHTINLSKLAYLPYVIKSKNASLFPSVTLQHHALCNKNHERAGAVRQALRYFTLWLL